MSRGRMKRGLSRHVDVFTCVSAPLASNISRIRDDVRTVPLGCSVVRGRHARVRLIAKTGRPIVGFAGGINYRLDYPLLLQLIQDMPDVHFIFVGPVQYGLVRSEDELRERIDRLFSFPNTTHITKVSKSQMPSYLVAFDVGIIPYDTSYPFNRFSFPMKSMEYLSAGLPVVANAISSLLPYQNDITVAHGTSGWKAALCHVLKQKKDGRLQKRRRSLAAQHEWRKKIDVISELIKAHEVAVKRNLIP